MLCVRDERSHGQKGEPKERTQKKKNGPFGLMRGSSNLSVDLLNPWGNFSHIDAIAFEERKTGEACLKARYSEP